MKKSFKIGIVVIVLVIIVLSSIVSGMKGISAETITLEKGYESYYFTEEGVVGSNSYFDVYSINNGEVVNVNVKEGDLVKKGDVLGVISSNQLDLEIETAKQQKKGYEAQQESAKKEDGIRKSSIKASIDELKANLATLELQQSGGNLTKEYQIDLQNKLVESSKEYYEKLEKDLEKYELLYKQGIVSKVEYDKFKSSVDSAKNVYEQNKSALEILNVSGVTGSKEYYESAKNTILVQIESLSNQYNQNTLSHNLEYYNSLIAISDKQIEVLEKQKDGLTIKSPFDGVVSKLQMNNTNYVNTVAPIATINTTSSLIETYISTRDIDSVSVDSPIKIVVDKRDAKTEYKGVVTSIENEAKVQISPLGVEERKIKVFVTPKEKLDLINGFDVDIQFLLYEADDVIAVPKESVFAYNDGYAVYKVVDGKVEIAEIEKGPELRSKIVISKGLENGDIIVKDASDDSVKSGVKISM